MLRGVVAVAGLLAASSAMAGEMSPEEARRFVVGKMFSYTCFEGTRGAGRVFADGSVVGTIQLRGEGPVRRAFLPAGTLKTTDRVCASLRGMPFEPCFNLDRTDFNSFRGSVSGLGFAYCDFTRGRSRVKFASSEEAGEAQPRTKPLSLRPARVAEAKPESDRPALRPALSAEDNR
jgi:hypothetical protein